MGEAKEADSRLGSELRKELKGIPARSRRGGDEKGARMGSTEKVTNVDMVTYKA